MTAELDEQSDTNSPLLPPESSLLNGGLRKKKRFGSIFGWLMGMADDVVSSTSFKVSS